MNKAKRAQRRIGRPKQGSSADARELLLDAAVTLFAEHGVGGTSIAKIAAKAGMTAAMVHYYFTNQSRLLAAVANERVLPAVTAVWAPVMDSSAVVPMLRGLVRRIFRTAEAHAWLPSLWLREVVSAGGRLRAPLLKAMHFEYVAHVIDTVAAAQRRGEVDPDLEPRAVVVSLLGNTLLPLAVSHVWQQVPLLQGIDRKRLARHAEALLVRGFCRQSGRNGDPTQFKPKVTP